MRLARGLEVALARLGLRSATARELASDLLAAASDDSARALSQIEPQPRVARRLHRTPTRVRQLQLPSGEAAP